MAERTVPSDHPMGMQSDDPKRWRALGVIAVAQLMIVLDATIVNVALPTAQRDLGISTADRQWVVTAYTLTFGGLLLLGGRIADYTGRKRTFIIGLIGFAGPPRSVAWPLPPPGCSPLAACRAPSPPCSLRRHCRSSR